MNNTIELIPDEECNIDLPYIKKSTTEKKDEIETFSSDSEEKQIINIISPKEGKIVSKQEIKNRNTRSLLLEKLKSKREELTTPIVVIEKDRKERITEKAKFVLLSATSKNEQRQIKDETGNSIKNRVDFRRNLQNNVNKKMSALIYDDQEVTIQEPELIKDNVVLDDIDEEINVDFDKDKNSEILLDNLNSEEEENDKKDGDTDEIGDDQILNDVEDDSDDYVSEDEILHCKVSKKVDLVEKDDKEKAVKVLKELQEEFNNEVVIDSEPTDKKIETKIINIRDSIDNIVINKERDDSDVEDLESTSDSEIELENHNTVEKAETEEITTLIEDEAQLSGSEDSGDEEVENENENLDGLISEKQEDVNIEEMQELIRNFREETDNVEIRKIKQQLIYGFKRISQTGTNGSKVIKSLIQEELSDDEYDSDLDDSDAFLDRLRRTRPKAREETKFQIDEEISESEDEKEIEKREEEEEEERVRRSKLLSEQKSTVEIPNLIFNFDTENLFDQIKTPTPSMSKLTPTKSNGLLPSDFSNNYDTFIPGRSKSSFVSQGFVYTSDSRSNHTLTPIDRQTKKLKTENSNDTFITPSLSESLRTALSRNRFTQKD